MIFCNKHIEGRRLLHKMAVLMAMIAFWQVLHGTWPICWLFRHLGGFVTSFRMLRRVGAYFTISSITNPHLKSHRALGSVQHSMESDLFEHITWTSSLINFPIFETMTAFKCWLFMHSSAIAILLPRAINFPIFLRVRVKMYDFGFLWYPTDTYWTK